MRQGVTFDSPRDDRFDGDEPHLHQRLGELFDVKYDLLLYDITSTYFEGQCPHQNGCVANNIPLKAETPCLPELGRRQLTKRITDWQRRTGDKVSVTA